LNNKASEYALSGISFERLINEFVKERNKLISKLKEKTDEEFVVQFKIDRHPYTLYNYILDFIQHDNHHRRQIEKYLQTCDVTYVE
jgi:uncharacterized damage-inducible protein DinB